jgi:hypothetical protein
MENLSQVIFEDISDDSEIFEGISDSDQSYSEKVVFAQTLSKFPILFEKSQTPQSKRKKDQALNDFSNLYGSQTGNVLNKSKIMKRIANVKHRTKEKIDINKTGNKKIKLTQYENIISELLRKDENPTICQLNGAMEVGTASIKFPCKPIKDKKVESKVIFCSTPRTIAKEKEKKPEQMKLEDLQRKVLMEQLKYLQLKNARLECKNVSDASTQTTNYSHERIPAVTPSFTFQQPPYFNFQNKQDVNRFMIPESSLANHGTNFFLNDTNNLLQ